MFNVRLAGGHLYGKQLFTWLSLVVSLMASFVLSFFPLDVLDEIWDLIESVSEGFLTYSYIIINLFHRNMAGMLYKANDAYMSRAADRTFVLGPMLVYLKYSGIINVYMTWGLGLLLL